MLKNKKCLEDTKNKNDHITWFHPQTPLMERHTESITNCAGIERATISFTQWD